LYPKNKKLFPILGKAQKVNLLSIKTKPLKALDADERGEVEEKNKALFPVLGKAQKVNL